MRLRQTEQTVQMDLFGCSEPTKQLPCKSKPYRSGDVGAGKSSRMIADDEPSTAIADGTLPTLWSNTVSGVPELRSEPMRVDPADEGLGWESDPEAEPQDATAETISAAPEDARTMDSKACAEFAATAIPPFSSAQNANKKRQLTRTSRNSRHQDRPNVNAMETLGPFALQLYVLLLEIGGHPYPQCVAEEQSEPLVIHLGSSQLIHAFLTERAEGNAQVRALLNAFQEDRGGNHAMLRRKCESLDTAIKRARRELADKWFLEMTPASAHTHTVIRYSVFLPRSVLRRQHDHGATRWRKGGGGGRVLVDARGNDIQNCEAWWKASARTTQEVSADEQRPGCKVVSNQVAGSDTDA